MASSGPATGLKRSWRRLRRRPVGMQLGVLLVVIAVIGGAVYGITSGTSAKKKGNPATGTTGTGSSGVGLGKPSGVGVDQASTSTRGVSAHSVNVVFPISNLTSL